MTSSADAGAARRGSDSSADRLSRSYQEAIAAGDASGAESIAQATLNEGFGVADLYRRVIAPAMWRIGALWERGAISVADEHLATALTHQVMAAIYGSNLSHKRVPGRLLLAAVEGEQHALGLRMAADVVELAGYKTIYLGADVPLDDLLQAIATRRPDLVLLGATMPHSRSELESSIGAIQHFDPNLVVLYDGQGARPLPESSQAVFVQGLEHLLGAVRSALGDSASGARSTPEQVTTLAGQPVATVPESKDRSHAETESGG